jgi:uncharacterized membrane protein YhaH (DUF805 family)
MAGIFISYRRDQSAAAAGRLADRLVQRFEKDHVFMDVDSIEPGVDFVKVLNDQVARCGAFIAVIGPGCADLRDRAGKRRLDDPHDYVRIEVEAALRRDIRVVPVLVDGAAMPSAETLPESLKALASRQAISVDHHRFAADVEALAGVLQRVLGLQSGKSVDKPIEGESAKPPSWADFWFSFAGRVSRKQYWLGISAVTLACIPIHLGLLAVLGFEEHVLASNEFKIIYFIATAIFFWPSMALIQKRLHDIGHGGWQLNASLFVLASLYLALDIAGAHRDAAWLLIAVFIVVIFLGCIKGKAGANEYGPDPTNLRRVTSTST